MILERLANKNDFSHVEIKIADYILSNLNTISNLSAKELGEKTFTSKASVIRFCQKLDLTGYAQFRRKLQLEIIERQRITKLVEKEPVDKNTSFSDLQSIIPSSYTNAFENINSTLDELSFKRIVSNIRKSSTVDIYGVGITHTCATAAMFKLRTLGINCNTYTALNEHYVRATKKNRNKVVIILSFTGGNQEMIKIAEALKQSNVFVIGIGGTESNDLKKHCDEYIKIMSEQLVLSMEVMAPYIAITYIFDLLFSALLVADFDRNVETAIDVINYKKN